MNRPGFLPNENYRSPSVSSINSYEGDFVGNDSRDYTNPFRGSVWNTSTPQRSRDPSPFQPIFNYSESYSPFQVEEKCNSNSTFHAISTPQSFMSTPTLKDESSPPTVVDSTPTSVTNNDDSKKKKRRKKKKKDETTSILENPELLRCYNCDQMGHLSRDCKVPRSCFLCGDTGHVAKQCKYSAIGTSDDDRDQKIASPEIPEEEDPDKKKSICLNCNEPGHRLKNCPYGRKCFQCGNVGHVARECPNISERIRMLQKCRDTPSPDSASAHTSSPFTAIHSPAMSSNSFSTLRTSSSLSMNSTPTNRQQSACSPPLFFGTGAFSSFSAHSAATLPSPTHDYADEVDDSHFQDLVTNLLTELDVNSDEYS